MRSAPKESRGPGVSTAAHVARENLRQPSAVGTLHPMLRLAATLMLLLQLRPIAAAAVCLDQAASVEKPCEMPMGSAPVSDGHGQQRSAPRSQSTSCPLAQLCAMSGPVVVPAIIVAPTGRVTLAAAAPTYLVSNRTTDPIAPPVPPPNS